LRIEDRMTILNCRTTKQGSRFLSIILIVSFILVWNLYTGNAERLDNMNQKITIDINSNGKKIELKVGDEIQIELESSGSTGYWWYFDKLDNHLFELISEDRRVIAGEREDVAGRPVTGIWTLRTKKPGSGIIKMKYYRVWEGGDKTINQFEIGVDITP